MKQLSIMWYNHGENYMIIKPNSTVVVYTNTQQKYHRSVHSRFDILYQEYKTVGYIEEIGVLCCGSDTVYYDFDAYVQDIMYSEFEEMTYTEYLKLYQDRLTRDNPHAPMLNELPNQVGSVSVPVNEYGQQNVTRQVLNANPVLSNLNDKGIKVQILRG